MFLLFSAADILIVFVYTSHNQNKNISDTFYRFESQTLTLCKERKLRKEESY
jgi:hypothetical protein